MAENSPSPGTASVQERFDRGGLWAAILVMFVWHFVTVLPNVVAGWARYGPVAANAPVWLAYLVAGAVSARVVLRGGGRSAVLPLVVCPVLLAGVAVGELVASGGFFGPYTWPFSVSGWFALVALWRRTRAELIGFFVANALVALGTLIALGNTDRVSLSRFVVLSAGVSVFQITIFVGSRAVTGLARRGAEAEDAMARARIRQLSADAVQTARRMRYQTVRKTVAGLLDGLATGRLDLAAPAARQQVAIAVTRLRRFLVESDEVPDPLLHELRACADAAERRGIAVDLLAPAGAVPALPVPVRRALTEPIIAVLAATASRARITVIGSPGEVIVAIVSDAGPAGPAAAPHDGVQVTADKEGEQTWAQARWADPSPLPS